jgi:hypothetical protein
MKEYEAKSTSRNFTDQGNPDQRRHYDEYIQDEAEEKGS